MALKRVADANDVPDGRAISIKREGVRLVLARSGESFFAAEDRCPHLGWSFSGGKVTGTVVTCPWHGSKYDLRTGENVAWVSTIRSVSVPEWSRRVIGLGIKPRALKVLALVRKDGGLYVDLGDDR
jgi:nitrite reductase/ring-hydroxylating ferredoxin subunit